MIKQLHRENEKQNAQYRLVFALLPLLPAAFFLSSLFLKSVTVTERLLCFTSLMSLVMSSFIISQLPLRQPDANEKKLGQDSKSARAYVEANAMPINAGLSIVLVLVSCFAVMSGKSYAVPLILYVVPGIIFVAILVARKTMLSVDVTHLHNLRYEYRGA